jgi:hypothetical protein
MTMGKTMHGVSSTSSAHTPGPWAICERAPNDQWYVGSTIFSIPLNKRVADISELNADCEANARLIAAAPDMLEALQLLMTAIDGGHAPQLDIWDNARAAIAKATAEAVEETP